MLKPKCHPYWIVDGNKVYNTNKSSTAVTSSGYVVPCCWTDNIFPDQDDMSDFGIYDEELKLKHHKTLKTILLSKQWIKLHNCLVNDPQNAPSVCKKHCHE